ncbi:hypothetical protein ACFLY5_01020, partial [Patescibacteria group bacterium]
MSNIHCNNQFTKNHIKGFVLHTIGLLALFEAYVGWISGEFFWIWDSSKILDSMGLYGGAFVLMASIAIPILTAIYGLYLAGIIPICCNKQGEFMWYDPKNN